MKKVKTVWHPESPGIRVAVRRWRFDRRAFATSREVLRSYRELRRST